jgi:hypothetical protein
MPEVTHFHVEPWVGGGALYQFTVDLPDNIFGGDYENGSSFMALFFINHSVTSGFMIMK